MDIKLLKKAQMLCVMLCCAVGAHAQTLVSGQVLSAEDNSPLIGANVIVEGTTQGATTDTEGRYTIKAKDSDVLVFSYIGCESVRETVGTRNRIDVRLKAQTNAMNEVVVMGYSTQTKAELSSAVVSLKGEELTNITSPDIGNMLQGKAAGVLVYNTSGQPGSQATIRVRGTGSITAASDPLYVVDGIIGGSFNPNDVETLTVLKDAGATALYGAEGAGGVIVVTTKSAKRGQKTTVNLKASAGVKQVLQGRLKMMDSQELYDVQKSFMPEVMFKAQRPESLLGRDFDWVDAIFRTGTVQNYYASVSGSTGKTNYFVSFDHYNEDGTLINTNFVRNSARVNLNTELYKGLTMNARLSYTDTRDYSASAWQTLEFAYGLLPWDNPYNDDGSPKDIEHDTTMEWFSQNRYNIFFNEQYNYAKSHGTGLVGDLQFIWQITPWLSFTTSNRYDMSNSKYITYSDPRTEITEPASMRGSLYNSLSKGWGLSTSNLLKAAHTWGDHSVSGLIGYEYGINKAEYTNVTGIGLPEGMQALNASRPSANGGYDIWGEGYSLFAQAQYSYANRYILTASFRADASSKFAPDNRVGYFPSVSGSWVINREKFLENASWLKLLKLRASWGMTGNSAIGDYLYLDSYALSASYNGRVSAVPLRKANPTLGWETADMTSVGIDANFWDRLEVTLDFYNIINKDLLLQVPKAPNSGFFEFTDNAGKVRNRGIEVAVTSTNIKHKNFTWTTSVNIGLNRNRVLSTPQPNGFIKSSSNEVKQIVKPGEDIYSWYMPKWMGVDPSDGDPVWEKLLYDENGKVVGSEPTNKYDDATPQIVGSAQPKFSGGFFNSFRLYGFTLDVACNFVYGNKIFNYDRITFDNDGAYTGYNMVSLDNGLHWKRWEQPGDVATHPKAVSFGNQNSNSISSRFLEDGGFFRIKNITLAYNFPKKITSKLHMQGLRIYVSTDNVATFTNFSGMDPEVDLQGTTYTLAGMYSSPYPVGRTYMFGIDVTF